MPLPIKLPPSWLEDVDDEADDDEESELPWHLTELALDKLHADGVRGAGVRVAVIDTGFFQSDLFSKTSVRALDRQGKAGGGDQHGHGTAMIGILVADDIGICPRAEILSVQAFSSTGASTASWIVEGIQTALALNPHVISISGGQPKADQRLAEIVKEVTDMGIVIVAAADNENPGEALYPASVPSAIAVTSSNDDRELVHVGPPGWIDIAAPGVNITTVDWDRLRRFSGTSEATAVTAGICALLLGAVKADKRAECGRHLLGFLTSTAQRATNDTGPGDCGILRPAAALKKIRDWSKGT